MTDATRSNAMDQPGHPVDILHQEHNLLLEVLAGLDREAEHLIDGGPVRLGYWYAALDFLEHYADRYHHGKEEEQMFTALEAAGLGHDHGPLAALRAEHDDSRVDRNALLHAVQRGEPAEIARVARGYSEQLRQHIDRENQVLLPLALEMLDDDACERLRAGFRAHAAAIGERVHARCLQLGKALAAGLDPGKQAPPAADAGGTTLRGTRAGA